jgi:flagellar hook assembly protein FlgD
VTTQATCPGTWTEGGLCTPNPCVAAGVEGGEVDGVLGVRAKPNPFAGSVSLRVAGPNATAARVLIFDAAGRLVRTAWNGMLNGRAFTVTWDGRDDSGREAATGIYMVRLESGSGNAIERLVKLR